MRKWPDMKAGPGSDRPRIGTAAEKDVHLIMGQHEPAGGADLKQLKYDH